MDSQRDKTPIASEKPPIVPQINGRDPDAAMLPWAFFPRARVYRMVQDGDEVFIDARSGAHATDLVVDAGSCPALDIGDTISAIILADGRVSVDVLERA